MVDPCRGHAGIRADDAKAMTKKLEFFYDYVSPYSYLANSQVGRFDESNLIYRPMFLGAVMQATGNKPPGTLEIKGKYLRKDIARWAKHYGIEYNRNPKFPLDTLKSLRLAIVAQQEGVFDTVHSELFDAAFVLQQDLGDDDVLAGIMKTAEMDQDATFSRIADKSVKDELKANTEEAINRGAFGAPTFFVGEEMFFGNDRFDFIREALV
jgi:2-hydroxychromene-2-carboxylate isomerase